jgi:hypothetical protein
MLPRATYGCQTVELASVRRYDGRLMCDCAGVPNGMCCMEQDHDQTGAKSKDFNFAPCFF